MADQSTIVLRLTAAEYATVHGVLEALRQSLPEHLTENELSSATLMDSVIIKMIPTIHTLLENEK